MPASSSGCRHIRVDWGAPFCVEADDCFLVQSIQFILGILDDMVTPIHFYKYMHIFLNIGSH